jgi:hypothetical protein
MHLRRPFFLFCLMLFGCASSPPYRQPSSQSPVAKQPEGKSISILVVERIELSVVTPNVAFYSRKQEIDAVIRACQDSGLFSVVGHGVNKPDLIADTRIFVYTDRKKEPQSTTMLREAGSVFTFLATGLLVDLTAETTRIVVKVSIMDAYGETKGSFERAFITDEKNYDLGAAVYDLTGSIVKEAHSLNIL